MIKKILLLLLIISLYSSYVDCNNINYSNTIGYNIQETIFSKIKGIGNYITTNIINEEVIYHTTEGTKNLFGAGKAIISNIINSSDKTLDSLEQNF